MTQAAMAHVLVIEDEARVRDQLCMMLSQEGNEHHGNGQKGMAVLRGLRTDTREAVIILTGYESAEVEIIAKTLGVSAMLKQGFSLHELQPAVKAMIRRMCK